MSCCLCRIHQRQNPCLAGQFANRIDRLNDSRHIAGVLNSNQPRRRADLFLDFTRIDLPTWARPNHRDFDAQVILEPS